MGTRGSFELTGFAELEAKLAELPNNIAKAATVRALKRAGNLMANAQRALVPTRTGNLRDSISVIAKSRNLTGLAEFGDTLSTGGTRQQATSALRTARQGGSIGTKVTLNIGASAPHAHLVEFGTVERFRRVAGAPKISRRLAAKVGQAKGASTGIMPAEPFIRPAFDSTKGAVLAAIKSELKAEITKTTARLARRAAKKIGT